LEFAQDRQVIAGIFQDYATLIRFMEPGHSSLYARVEREGQAVVDISWCWA
jgi:hypothetical protein